jgi:hypothetical protein
MKRTTLLALVWATAGMAQIDSGTRLTESTNQTLRGTVEFAEATFTPVTEGRQQFTKVEIPGLVSGSGNPGIPAIPRWRALIAVPDGATPVLRLARPVSKPARKVHVYPYQALATEFSTEIDSPKYQERQPPPSLYQGQPFTINADAYASRNALPPGPCSPPQIIGKMRDLTIASVECAAGQYIPAEDSLTLFSSIDFQIDFTGGTGFFLTRASFGAFENEVTASAQAMLNGGIVGQYVAPVYEPKSCKGEEMLILTHPNYMAAAQDLASWRNQHGTPTNVFAVNDGPGPGPDTNTDIQAFIDWRFDNCTVRLKYVVLLGGAADIPTFDITRLLYENTTPPTLIATDFPYASHNASPTAKLYVPFFHVGRIPVASAADAKAAVDKIKAYETGPSSQKSFYTTANIASYFECCNPNVGPQGVEDANYIFLTLSEGYRQTVLNNNFTSNRLYATDTAFHQMDYFGDPTPRYFANQTPLPAVLLPPNKGFATTNTDVANALAKGANFLFHEDHGWTGGWGQPSFGKSDVPSLTNPAGLVFNMDCSSGDFEADSFVQHMISQPNGGAAGLTGFTRMSNVKYFPALTTGIMDAFWPNTDPAFGANNVTWQKFGQVFDWAKLHMVNTWTGGDLNAPDAKNTLNHVRLWHLFGDPAMSVWTSVPAHLPAPPVIHFYPGVLDVVLDSDGATITAMQTDPSGVTTPIGRGVVAGGVARVEFTNTPDAALPIVVVASAPNVIPMSVTVSPVR